MTENKMDEFNSVLREYFPNAPKAHEVLRQTYRTLVEAAEIQLEKEAQGIPQKDHGIMAAVKVGHAPLLEELLEGTEPYNGIPHNVRDADSGVVAYGKRIRDGAIIVESNGYISNANEILPMNKVELKRQYGIKDLNRFFGEEIGTRKLAALYSSGYFGPTVAIMTMHEKDEQGRKDVRLWVDGDLVFSLYGHKLNWEYSTKRPQEAQVIDFPARPVKAAGAY